FATPPATSTPGVPSTPGDPGASAAPGDPAPRRTRAAASLSVTELSARLRARASGADDFVLLDVREPWEREFAGIDGSVLVPLQSLLSAAAEEVLPKDAEILVHCHHNTRSQYAREVMLQSGWQHVTFVEGGIEAWSVEIDPEVARY
ncbi:MAG: sulfur-carrier protein adenylyltransferase/sulfurtransferase, partial [Subtercola sp.]|nr:sulfur-carrier protein adenylyltransferase/sulfurtransferase [Subtercola sp.]